MKFQRWLQKNENKITLVSGLLIAVAFLGELLHIGALEKTAFIIASIIGALPIFIHAYQALKVKVISIELLVSIAVIGAFIIGEYNESAIVTFLFLFGHYLEVRTLTKTRNSIKALTQMAPTTATLLHEDGTTEEVDVDEVEIGDRLLVKTGGKVPVDGNVIEGTGYADEASITGESKEVKKEINSQVFSGSILTDGVITIEAEKVGEDTTFGKIIELVEEAQDTKSHAEKFIDQFAKYYTPGVLVIAFIVYLITKELPLAITVLVLGCPGALVIGAPVSNVAGIGNGAKHGILVKGADAMHTFAKIDTFVFDKTGTLTKGNTTVSKIISYDNNEKEMMTLLAAMEKLSDHPLGRAIVHYGQEKELSFEEITFNQHETVKGKGLKGNTGTHEILAGNEKLLVDAEINLTASQQADLLALQQTGSSVVIVAIDGKLSGIVGVSDEIRPEVKPYLESLRKQGAKHLVMLTGDNHITAEYVAKELGIDEVHAELLPDEKVQHVKQMKQEGRKVAFIGDGVNDSPSLATAEIGIAMGSGTDVAIETSDVVLMKSDFKSLAHAYGLAKKTVLNTNENIVIAVGVVIFLLIGLFAGFIYMASGMFVHEASILVVIFNAIRLIYYGQKDLKN